MKTKITTDFFRLFFPQICNCCENSLLNSEYQICTECLLKLPLTDFINLVNNPVEKIFWGRVPICKATAYIFFSKKSTAQRLLHQMKYKGNNTLAITLGKQMGIELAESKRFQDIDIIIPVPLHPKKLRKRGYNQSCEIAKGIVQHYNRAINTISLIRTEYTQTQTKKNRYDRWENVHNKFSIQNPEAIEGKHILLVDDVITTGATLESCAQQLLTVNDVKVSIAGLTFSKH